MLSIVGLPLGGIRAVQPFRQHLSPRSCIKIGSQKRTNYSPERINYVNYANFCENSKKESSGVIYRRHRQSSILSSTAGRSPVTDSYDSYDSFNLIEPVDTEVEPQSTLPQKASVAFKIYKTNF